MRKDGEKERKEYEAARRSLVRRRCTCLTPGSPVIGHCLHSRGDETAAQKVLEGIEEDDMNPVGPTRGSKGGGGKKSKRKRSLVEDYDM